MSNIETLKIPNPIPVLALRNNVLFPQITLPLSVGRERSLESVRQAIKMGDLIAIVAQRDAEILNPEEKDLHTHGTLARIHKASETGQGITFLAQGLKRIRVTRWIRLNPVIEAEIAPLEEIPATDVETEALFLNLKQMAQRLVQLASNLPNEVMHFIENIEDPGILADLAASHLNIELEDKQRILEQLDVKLRVRQMLQHLHREVEIAELRKQIDSEIRGKFDKTQREMFLREQMKAIQRELGDSEGAGEIEEVEKAVLAAQMPPTVLEAAKKELARLRRTQPASSEYSVIRTYLDWLVELPWATATEDNPDIAAVEALLAERHYGLEKVKRRIVEFLAVRQLRKSNKGPILCLAGPPGVGKTSLGQSIADALGRKFARISLGGVRDEAEIRGHRRTYVGALPGKVIQAMKKAGTRNPLIILDEIDKVGSDFRGDPSSALLEVLDPEQNVEFSDHYIEHPFDLSQVLFITTANQLDTIHPALRDRMEIIEIAGYTEEEKLEIARRHLVPRQREEHGLKEDQLIISEEALRQIVSRYTREAGVRNLTREIAAIARGVARQVASGRQAPACVTGNDLYEYLGPEKFTSEIAATASIPGVVTGLAWTPFGGDILFTETSLMNGKGDLVLTGQLGDVMKESARTALTYLLSRSEKYGIDPHVMESHDVHIHFPAGATPKDGPSAGVTILTALASLLTGRPVDGRLAMTGEITLRGQVLPIGGLKEKLLAARRAGVKDVIVPERNRKDMDDIPKDLLSDLKLHFVNDMNDVLQTAMGTPANPAPYTNPAPSASLMQ